MLLVIVTLGYCSYSNIRDFKIKAIIETMLLMIVTLELSIFIQYQYL
jgi:hypothetical protein